MENNKNSFLRPLDGISLDHSAKAFDDFVSAGNYTVDEVKAAHFTLLGLGDVSSLDKKSVAVLEKMQHMEKEGYPVNHFARAIEAMGDVDAPKNTESTLLPSLFQKKKKACSSPYLTTRAPENLVCRSATK